MSSRTHLSIGEVLSLLHDEFPDVTISKIRFLESQGLIDPERTPSGYRKFYDADVARLRWILRQQREHFLPLKVIKDRLDGGEPLEPPAPERSEGLARVVHLTPNEPEVGSPALPAGSGGAGALGAGPVPVPAPPAPLRPSLLAGGAPVSLTLDELATATGSTPRELAELERFGLLQHREGSNGTPVYDEDALAVAQSAAAFRALGVEARHLRMYKVATEREAGFVEQLLLPLLKQRGAKGRQEVASVVEELLTLGDTVRGALLRQALRPHLPTR
jgi:DNA-binding transcriptional MerR regulator